MIITLIITLVPWINRNNSYILRIYILLKDSQFQLEIQIILFNKKLLYNIQVQKTVF